MFTPESFMAAQKAQFETWMSLGGTAFEGAEKLTELNLSVGKAMLSDAAETAQAMLSIKDPQELIALQSGLVKPAGEKMMAYHKQVYGIAAATGSEFGKAAQASLEDLQKRFMAAMDVAFKNAPAGSEGVVALMKSAMEGASSAYESAQKSSRQVAEVAAANLSAFGDQVVKTAPARSRKAA